MDKYAGVEWLINGTEPHKYNQLQSLELACRISKHHIKESEVNMFNPIFKLNV